MSLIRNRRPASLGPHQQREYGRWRPSRGGRRHLIQNTFQGAICATVLGMVFIIGSAYFEFTTEQHYITRSRDISSIQSNVKNPSSFFQRMSTNDPMYVTDQLHVPSDSKPPMDTVTGVSHNAFVIRREIEMYQWTQQSHKERQRSSDGTAERDVTTYSYTKQWSSSYLDSHRFKYPEGHYNPQHALFTSVQHKDPHIWSQRILLGKYPLSPQRRELLLEDAGSWWMDITSTVYDQYFKSDGYKMRRSYIYWSSSGDEYGYNNYGDSTEPNVGDVRIRYLALNLEGIEATFLGAMDGMKRLNAHQASSGNEYIYLKVGRTDSVQEVIDCFHSDNSNTLWMWRGLTLLFMCLGFVCVSSIATYIASWIPICGGLIGCGVHCAAVLLGMVVYVVFFIIAYFSARKEIAMALIVAVLLGLMFVQGNGMQKDKETEDTLRKEGETKSE